MKSVLTELGNDRLTLSQVDIIFASFYDAKVHELPYFCGGYYSPLTVLKRNKDATKGRLYERHSKVESILNSPIWVDST